MRSGDDLWLILTHPVDGVDIRRRINFAWVVGYEANAAGTSYIVATSSAIQQVLETVDEIDAALADPNHKLRVRNCYRDKMAKGATRDLVSDDALVYSPRFGLFK